MLENQDLVWKIPPGCVINRIQIGVTNKFIFILKWLMYMRMRF